MGKKKRFNDAKAYISEYVGRKILQPELVSKDSLLGCLLSLYNEEELDEQQVIDEVLSFLGSGVETAGIMLVWIAKCYLDYPQQAEVLRAELIEQQLNCRTALSNKKFSNYVMEVLRHYPAAWAMIRYIEDNQISGVEADSFVWLSPCVTHFDPRYWEEPESFKPDRFDYPYNKNAYFPFSQGTHKCFGEYLAMNQMKAFVYHCTTKLDIQNSNICVKGYSSKLALSPKKITGRLVEKA
ncbi:cytochrome P450 [Photobacterium sp. Hal280]|uniref:cytochrome P450 n=1 Tax=Photobacterium sp. Hal280 TaxID=3035163 RepID=UPI00301BFE63